MNRFALTPLLCALIAAAIYYPSLSFDFTYDDLWQIMRNPTVSDGRISYWQAAITPTAPGNLFRPIPILSYKLTWNIFGAAPFFFHLSNLVLYALLCFLVAKIVMCAIGVGWLSLCVSLLFTLHPLHVESVASIVGRAELLAAIFGILHFSALIQAQAQTRYRAAYLFGATMALVCAALSKESALVFALLAPLYFILRAQRSALRSAVVCGTAGAIVAIGLRLLALGSGFFDSEAQLGFVAENPLAALSFLERLVPALIILGSYLQLTVLPYNLSADYSLMAEQFYSRIYSLQGVGWALLLSMYLGAIWRSRRNAELFFGLWFLVSFALTSNIFWPIGTVQAERLALTPSLGAIVFISAVLNRLIRDNRLKMIMAALAVIGFALVSTLRIPVWRDNLTLFEKTALDAALSPKAQFNYGIELYARGQKEAAESALRNALDLNPAHLPAARALADLLLEKRDLGKVEYWYRRILTLDPDDAQVRAALEQLLKLKQR